MINVFFKVLWFLYVNLMIFIFNKTCPVPINDTQTLPQKWSDSHERCAETNEKTIFWFLLFLSYGIFYSQCQSSLFWPPASSSSSPWAPSFWRITGLGVIIIIWCTYTEHLMHEISNLMQGFTVYQVTNNVVYVCIQYFFTILW